MSALSAAEFDEMRQLRLAREANEQRRPARHRGYRPRAKRTRDQRPAEVAKQFCKRRESNALTFPENENIRWREDDDAAACCDELYERAISVGQLIIVSAKEFEAKQEDLSRVSGGTRTAFDTGYNVKALEARGFVQSDRTCIVAVDMQGWYRCVAAFVDVSCDVKLPTLLELARSRFPDVGIDAATWKVRAKKKATVRGESDTKERGAKCQMGVMRMFGYKAVNRKPNVEYSDARRVDACLERVRKAHCEKFSGLERRWFPGAAAFRKSLADRVDPHMLHRVVRGDGRVAASSMSVTAGMAQHGSALGWLLLRA